MNEEPKPIKVHVLGKDYLVGCREGEKEALLQAAKYLDDKMREVRDGGKVIGSERIAVITALNITNDLLHNRNSQETLTHTMDDGIQRMVEKIDQVL